MITFNYLMAQALLVLNAKLKKENTAKRVGGLFRDILYFIQNMLLGIILKGEKANELDIKATSGSKRGDTYKTTDTGHYWCYDGNSWNNIGEIIPSELDNRLLNNIQSRYLFALVDSSNKKLLTFDKNAIPYIANLDIALTGMISENSLNSELNKAIEPLHNLEVIQNKKWLLAVKSGDQITLGVSRVDGSVYCNKLVSNNEKSENNEVPYRVYVIPQSLENVMHASQEWEHSGMFFYNVIKKEDGTWQMWYSTFKKGWTSEYQNYLCYAHSSDGKNWIKEIPGRENNIIHSGWDNHSGWVEQYVFIDPNDTIYPYRMIYAALENGNGAQKIWLTKSIDGIHWIDNKVVFETKHDSQYSAEILPDGNYLIFIRMWNTPTHTERQIGTVKVTPDGEVLRLPQYLTGGSYYNAPSFKLKNNTYILFPTHYDHYSQDIDMRVCFWIDGRFIDTGQSLSKFLFQDDIIGHITKWSVVMPGFIPTGEINTYWMYYYTSNRYHNDLSDRSMVYSRIKIKIEPI